MKVIGKTLVLITLLPACKPTTVPPRSATADAAKVAAQAEPAPFAHGVTLYVNAINCEMNAEDARRLSAFATRTGISVEVALVGVPGNDSLLALKIRGDLGLLVPSRVVRNGELTRFKSIGIARMPMAVVIRGKQLSTIISGEFMPKTLGLIEAAFLPAVMQ